MNTIFKPESFVNFKKINFKVLFNENKTSTENQVESSSKNKKFITINENLIKQEIVLNILEELRYFDNKNGTKLFKNILYNDLKKFIYTNKF